MKIIISAIGKDVRSSQTYKLFEEYKKRTPWTIDLKEFEYKKPLPSNLLKEKEADLLLASADSFAKTVALDENGINMSSEELANRVARWQGDGCSSLAFLIGGAAGHGSQVIKKADLILSFGKLTWPHMMVRAMLAEQIYRINTIISGHPYHRY